MPKRTKKQVELLRRRLACLQGFFAGVMLMTVARVLGLLAGTD